MDAITLGKSAGPKSVPRATGKRMVNTSMNVAKATTLIPVTASSFHVFQCWPALLAAE